MDILMTILYIVLFIVFLSLLIIIHELGHLTMAKVFKVYCKEFSIGMGPLLFKKKRVGGETQFSIRAIPFGGYVSMYGEQGEDPDSEIQVDKSRALSGIKKWKRAIIMVAGVTMNVVASIVLFFIANLIPRSVVYVDEFTIDSQASEIINFEQGDYLFEYEEIADGIINVKGDICVYYTDGQTNENISAVLDYSDFSFKKTNISNYLNFYNNEYTGVEKEDGSIEKRLVIKKANVVDISFVQRVTFDFKLYKVDENGDVDPKLGKKCSLELETYFDEQADCYFYEETFIKSKTSSEKVKGFGNLIGKTFKDFGDGATVVFKSLGMLFTEPSSWSDAGGIIAVGFVTTSYLQNLGWNYFIYLWGVISINLAIVNILPFPGLDGWHLLVIIIEGITKKEIPQKVKTIVSFIGIALLFGLMICLVFKDVFKYIFNIGVFLL